MTTQRSYNIASIPGDGIGEEVVHAGVRVLQALSKTLGFSVNVTEFDWNSERYKKSGQYLPPNALDTLKTFDAILFGSVGDPEVPDHISLWGLRLAICQGLQQYANIRPTKILNGVDSPLKNVHKGDLDWVIVRENSEGEYAGQGGRSHIGYEHEIGTEVAIFTRNGIKRTVQHAFEIARSRPRKLLTYVTKSNAQRNGMVLWDEVIESVAKDYPDVTYDKMLVDAMTCRMTLDPKSLDTIVATNLHADILSDLAAALAGSIGIAPTSNLDPSRKHPSMFEPIHGSAFDITGKGIANPVGTFWTISEMLAWIGERDASKLLFEAIEQATGKGLKTRDLGGNLGTEQVADAVIAEINQQIKN